MTRIPERRNALAGRRGVTSCCGAGNGAPVVDNADAAVLGNWTLDSTKWSKGLVAAVTNDVIRAANDFEDRASS
jgi:hypothetical protein